MATTNKIMSTSPLLPLPPLLPSVVSAPPVIPYATEQARRLLVSSGGLGPTVGMLRSPSGRVLAVSFLSMIAALMGTPSAPIDFFTAAATDGDGSSGEHTSHDSAIMYVVCVFARACSWCARVSYEGRTLFS